MPMKRVDRIIFGIILGGAFPFLLALLSVVLWFYFDKSENRAPIYLISGLAIGALIDIKYLKGWINRRYELPIIFILSVYILYNIALYGMFMGFPVINMFTGVVAGYYSGMKILYMKIPPDKQTKIVNQAMIITGMIMLLISISSGYIAIRGEGVGYEVQGMLRLSFEITKAMIFAITFVGGISLIILTIALTKISIIKTIKYFSAYH